MMLQKGRQKLLFINECIYSFIKLGGESMSRLWYQSPAKVWEEALPLGNGKLGAMIFGNVSKERIQLNEDSVWYGGPVDRNNKDALKNLPKIRELLLSGRISEAEELMLYALSGTPNSEHPYQTLGDLYIDFKDINGDIKEYERSLSLEDAIYSNTFVINDISYKREAFVSAPNNVLVLHMEASKEKSINFSALLTRGRFFDYVKKVSDKGICLGGNLGKGGYDFAMELMAESKDGEISVIGEHLIVKDATEITLYFTAGTTYRLRDLELELNECLNKAMSVPYHTLKEEHIGDYQSLYKKVTFTLEGVDEYNKIPTDVRLREASNGNVDIGLTKLYFDFGRYLLISSSRKGSLAATLQGIWNKDLTPPWDSKYTININTQMNYWPAESCNLSDCHLPLFDLIKKMLPNGRETAKVMYGCRGFVAHHNTDIWGDTAVQDHWIPGSYWVMGAAWLCTHIWTHYEYTMDIEFLKEYYDIMREAALFFLDFLIEDDGYLKTCPSVSPENTFILPSGERGANTAGVTMDNQILRDLFSQCLKASKVLNVQDELDEKISLTMERLVPTKIGSKGQILEWPYEYEEAEPGHRHISHLYGLHPSEQILMDKTKELAEAAKVTLKERLSYGGGHTGWSRAWIINLYARLWDPEAAYHNIEMLLGKSTLSNMFDNHPPFQIDGNFGGTAGILELFLQSTMERVVLLPALPSALHSGSISGICIKGGGEVSLEWRDMKLVSCIVTAKCDLNTKFIYKDKLMEVSMTKGEVKKLEL